MAKSKSQQQARAATRRRASAPDEEGLNRRLVIGLVGVLLVAVVGLIAVGWYWTQVRPYNKTVLRVNNISFSLSHVVRRMELENTTNAAFYQQSPTLLPTTVITQLEREAKLLTSANKLNKIKVTDKEVDERIRETGGLTAAASPAEFVAELDRQVSDSGLKKDEYLQMLRAQLLDEKVGNYFTYIVPEKEPQVRARWIAVSDETAANEALDRLNAGEDFATVATEVSIDPATSPEGGELGWRVRGQLFVDEVEQFLFDDAKVGDRSDVISSSFGFYIAELEEKEEDRAVDATQRPTVANRLTTDWLDGLNTSLTIKNDFTEADQTRALNKVF